MTDFLDANQDFGFTDSNSPNYIPQDVITVTPETPTNPGYAPPTISQLSAGTNNAPGNLTGALSGIVSSASDLIKLWGGAASLGNQLAVQKGQLAVQSAQTASAVDIAKTQASSAADIAKAKAASEVAVAQAQASAAKNGTVAIGNTNVSVGQIIFWAASLSIALWAAHKKGK